MKNNYSIYNVDLNTSDFTPFTPHDASSLSVKEKNIENWMATKPELLFSNPDAVMIIAQEISGEVMADFLACSQWGYNLPVKSSLCKMYNGKVCQKITDELMKRDSLDIHDL